MSHFVLFVGDKFRFIHDNSRAYSARYVFKRSDYLPNELAKTKFRQIQLNMLGKPTRVRQIVAANKNDLRPVISEDWEQIPRKMIQRHLKRMPRRMEGVEEIHYIRKRLHLFIIIILNIVFLIFLQCILFYSQRNFFLICSDLNFV